MSTVLITMGTQPKDFAPVILGSVNLTLTVDGQDYALNLELSPGSGYRKFQEVIFVAPQADSDAQQQANYASAMRRDYVAVGGVGGSSNIKATVTPTGVLVTSVVGTFSAGVYTGNLLTGVTFDYNNAVQPSAVTLGFVKTGNGNCDTEQYRAQTATGGAAPYRLEANGTELFNSWDGASDRFVDLGRSTTYKIVLYDNTGAALTLRTVTPARKLVASDFTAEVNPYLGYADLVVSRVVVRAGTDPLGYNLVDSNLLETGWQSSAVFGGISPGLYTVKIRDVYQCEVTKQVNVEDILTPLQENRPTYFSVSEFNSLAFYRESSFNRDNRKNYSNTPSWKESVGIPYSGAFRFPEGGPLNTQFRSSYPVHQVSLHKYDQVPQAIPFFLIQENLGITERVDCKLFRIESTIYDILGNAEIDNGILIPNTAPNGMGVYFDGGNSYEANTENVSGSSPYTIGLPSWAQVGNFVSLSGVGTYPIVETDLFDEDRGVYYFKLDFSASEGSGIIQTTWDRHPYNVYKIPLSRSDFDDKGAFIRINPGVEVDGELQTDVNNIHRSERFYKVEDTSKLIKITWSAFRNIGEMLFTDGTQGEMWLQGRVRPFSNTDSEFDDTDDGSVSIDQSALLRMRAFFPILTARQWRKLDLVGTIGNRGLVHVEDMELIKIGATEQEELDDTNLSNVTVEFSFSGESSAISQEDPVFSLDTGTTIVPDGGPLSGREDSTLWRIDGNRLVADDGDFIRVIDGQDELYVEIN